MLFIKRHPKLVRVLSAAIALVAVLGAAEFFAPRAEAVSGAPLYRLYQSSAALYGGSVTLRADGRQMSYSAGVGSVDDLLKVAGIEVGENDVVSPARDALLEPGMTVEVLRATVRTETVTEVAPYDVIRKPNEYIPKGTENVITKGADGERKVTYEVITVGGVEVYRRAVSTVVTVEPVDEIVEYGPGGAILTEDGRVLKWSYKIDGNATAYTTEGFRQKHNALGRIARPGTIAVDPKVIPLKSSLYVCSRDDAKTVWDYGECVAEDTGGAVKGNIVDLFFSTLKECYAFGRRNCTIYVLE